MLESLYNPGMSVESPHGVYVVMNGKCFQWNKVKKNKELGEFEEIY